MATGDEVAAKLVTQEPAAIGYLLAGVADDRVKVLSVESTMLSLSAVSAGDWPITWPVNLVTHVDANVYVLDFLDFSTTNRPHDQLTNRPMHKLALSTMWLQRRFDHLIPFFEAGHEMGFQAFEFSHILYLRFFDRVEPGDYQIIAVHDPCPRPNAGPGQLSALDEAERRRAVEVAKTSIDTAVRFGARAVVLHIGRVDGISQHEQALRDLHRRGQYGMPAYTAARERLVIARAVRAPAHLTAVRRSLQEIVEHAEQRGVRVGLENRVHYFEIPSFEEMQELLDELPADVVGFWYDTGHARVLDNLGFVPCLTWAETFASRMVGVHFHDVGGLRDHLLPGMAEIDFGAIAPHIPEDAVRTCEFDWHFGRVGVKAGVEHLRRAGCV